MAAVTICSDFGAQEKNFVTVSIVTSSIFHEVMGLDAMILVFLKVEFSNQFTLPPALRGNTLFKVSSPALNILVLLLF